MFARENELGRLQPEEEKPADRRLFEESQKLWAAYRDLPQTEFIRKRAEDVWNRIDAMHIKIHEGEAVKDADADELIQESTKIRNAIIHKNY